MKYPLFHPFLAPDDSTGGAAVADATQTQTAKAPSNEEQRAALTKAAEKTAAFFKQGNHNTAEVHGTPEDLFEKHRRKMEGDIEADKKSKSGASDTSTDNATATDKTGDDKTSQAVADDDKEKQKPGFIKTLKQTNAELEKKAKELEEKIAKYEAEKLPELENKINDLQSKIDEGGSKKQIEELQGRLTKVQAEKDEREAALAKENSELKRSNSFYNLLDDPDFKAKYVEPQNEAYQQVAESLGNDQSLLVEFNKAAQAYTVALNSRDQMEQNRQREVYMSILNGIYENLSDIEKGNFRDSYGAFLNSVKKYTKAVQNWEVEKQAIDTDRAGKQAQLRGQISRRWKEANDVAKKTVEPDIAYPEIIAKTIASHKIDDDISHDAVIAEAATQDNTNVTAEEIARVLQQGAQFKRLKAINAAKDKIISELEETIKKMRGSSTSDSSLSSSGGNGSSQQQKIERTPEGLFEKFRARQQGNRAA